MQRSVSALPLQWSAINVSNENCIEADLEPVVSACVTSYGLNDPVHTERVLEI